VAAAAEAAAVSTVAAVAIVSEAAAVSTVATVSEEVAEVEKAKGAEDEKHARPTAFPSDASISKAPLSFGAGSRLSGRIRFLIRQVVRSPQKTMLTLFIALLFTISITYLQESMVSAEQEIDRLYHETVVRVDITAMGTFVPRQLADTIKESNMAANIYYEASFTESFVIAPDESGGIPENWQEMIGFNPHTPMVSWENWLALDNINAVTDLEMFLEVHSNVEADGIFGSVNIDFAPGFDSSAFAYNPGSPLPIIISERTSEARGLSFGDDALLVMRVPASNPIIWERYPSVIVGIHNGHVQEWQAAQAVIIPMPFELFDNLAGRTMLYSRINFNVVPEFNRHLDLLLTAFGSAFFGVGQRWDMMLWDSQLNELTGAMEWVLLFLELLYPVALFAAGAISLVLAALLTMQLGKNAAIMRSVGAPKRSVCAALLGEQLGVFLTGILLGLIAVFALGWGMDPLTVLAAAAVSLLGAVVGSLIAVVIVVVLRSPMEMLQIRE
jgi:hypothetical protein